MGSLLLSFFLKVSADQLILNQLMNNLVEQDLIPLDGPVAAEAKSMLKFFR